MGAMKDRLIADADFIGCDPQDLAIALESMASQWKLVVVNAKTKLRVFGFDASATTIRQFEAMVEAKIGTRNLPAKWELYDANDQQVARGIKPKARRAG